MNVSSCSDMYGLQICNQCLDVTHMVDAVFWIFDVSKSFLDNALSVHLTGTKLGCGEGGCGACTVMVSSYDRATNDVTHVSVNACLAPLCSVDGMAVTTVEGIGSTRTILHPCQVGRALVEINQTNAYL